ncbi:MAG: hypothetical protein V4490_06265 [Pseudomonadota bacterium]
MTAIPTQLHFHTSGYVVLKNLVSDTDIKRLNSHLLDTMAKGTLDDGQVPGSPSCYLDPEVEKLQLQLTPQIEADIGKQLIPVFCYHRVYRTGAVLRMHKDSTRAEISATINLGQTGSPWPIWLIDYDENPHCVVLESGDALIYYGNRLYHWRGKLVGSDYVTQIMFHYIDRAGKNKMAARLEFIRRIRKRVRSWFRMNY